MIVGSEACSLTNVERAVSVKKQVDILTIRW